MKAPTEIGETQLRIDMAALFRLTARCGMHEAVANHFSAAVSADGKKFLMNPKWRHFSQIKASELLLLDADDTDAMARNGELDPTAWAIHAQIHKRLRTARVVMHLHPTYATAIACLADPEIKPVDQNTARYFNRVAIDRLFGGMADSETEGARIAGALGSMSRLMMGNHGVLISANTVGEAFDDCYTFERACKTLVLAYSTTQKLNILPPEIAEKTARDWEGIKDFSIAHFEEMKKILDKEDPSYAD